MSAVCLKQAKPKKCIYYCKLALDFEPQNIKSLFRYGQVNLKIFFDHAILDFKYFIDFVVVENFTGF